MYDIFLKNASIIDPERRSITVAGMGIKDGRIAAITRDALESAKEIDCTGLYLSPGFIDIHAHIESNPAQGMLMCQQGVTTVINGNCGMSPENLPEFLERDSKKGFAVNQYELQGATSLRMQSGHMDSYSPMSTAELDTACGLLEDALSAGAAGLSFGLEYQPGSSKEEVLALSRIAARHDKPIAIHIRTDYYPGLTALKEAIDICRYTGAGVQISHVVYQFGYGMMHEALHIIDSAVNEGLDITCDSGMYTSFATFIGTAVFDESCFDKWQISYDSLVAANGKYAGQRLSREKYYDLRKNHPNDAVIALIGVPHEIPLAFTLPYMMLSSDAGVNQSPDTSMGHPQDSGTFPRFLRMLVRETGQLTLVDAVRRMTILPAERMELSHKGRIGIGMDADLTLFDLSKITDRGLFPHEGRPDTLPDGIEAVVINGQLAVHKKNPLKSDAGRTILVPNTPFSY